MFSQDKNEVDISKTALVPHTAEQIFTLINDIERYPDFLDGCTGASIVSQSDTEMQATLELSKHGIQQSFTTKNLLTKNERVHMSLADGPFESLTGEWTIAALADQGCRLSLDLQFTMGNSLMFRLAAPLFEQMGNRLLDAVVAEAGRRFGA